MPNSWVNALVAERLSWNGNRCITSWNWIRNITGRTGGELSDLEARISKVKMDFGTEDYWAWKLCGSGKFSTSSLTNLLTHSCFPTSVSCIPTEKNYLVPKKVGVFVWRVRRKRIPVLFELGKRGIDLHSVLCPLCGDEIESVDHTLFSCNKVQELWVKVFAWWGLVPIQFSLDDMLSGLDKLNVSECGRKICQALIWVTMYLIWKNRNNKVFKNSSWSSPVALCEIQSVSFEWIGKRCKAKKDFKNIDWLDWLHNPISTTL